MFGSSVGIQFGGTTIGTRTLTINVPSIDATADFLPPLVSGGASVQVPHISVTGELKVPTIAIAIKVPSIDVTADFLEPSIAGGANIGVPAMSITGDFIEPSFTFIVPGIPGLIAERSGTTVDLTFSDRDGKKIGVWRADEFNLNFSEIATVDADTYSDTGLTATLNYKYRIQFVSTVGGSVSARGRLTGSKLTKA